MVHAQEEEQINAQVIAVFPDKVRIVVDDLEDFKIAEESLKVGSYVKIADNENAILIASSRTSRLLSAQMESGSTPSKPSRSVS
jgi:hypothetical protein